MRRGLFDPPGFGPDDCGPVGGPGPPTFGPRGEFGEVGGPGPFGFFFFGRCLGTFPIRSRRSDSFRPYCHAFSWIQFSTVPRHSRPS